ncbi:hypothetical protein AOA60_07375 [Pseudomonas sp. 2822-17]|nr:hypothetical protein AOA60_07375 [Pseudomonas sp. 2822-17]
MALPDSISRIALNTISSMSNNFANAAEVSMASPCGARELSWRRGVGLVLLLEVPGDGFTPILGVTEEDCAKSVVPTLAKGELLIDRDISKFLTQHNPTLLTTGMAMDLWT